jgi:hypothetical protein
MFLTPPNPEGQIAEQRTADGRVFGELAGQKPARIVADSSGSTHLL